MPVTGPFYDFSGAPYYYNTDTQQRVSANVPAGTSLGSSPALGSVAQPAFIPQNVSLGAGGGGAGGNDLNALAAAFNSSGALTQQQINNQKAQFDANLEFQRQQMEQIGLPQLVIQQRLADLQQQQFQYQMYLTQQQQGLAQSGLGLQALQAQAQLGGPSNWVQAYNLAQGLKQTDIPVFEQRLLTGQQTPSAVGGAGLSDPQSMFTLAAQAGAGGGAGGVPGVTINGQPVAGGQTSIGGQINPSLAPMPFLSQAGGGGGVGAAGAPGGYGGSSAPVFNAPGPNSPNDTARGSLMGGTTGMFQGATQNFGIGPGQGSNSVSGTRGTNMVGYDPATGQLQFDSQFLQPKSKVVYNLFDQTTGQNVADNSAVMGAIKGTGSGWSGAYYVPGGNGRYTFQGVTPNNIDPSHMYRIRIALPDEGGGVGDAMEQDVSGSTILNLPNHNAAQQQQAAPAPAPAPAPAAAPAAAPTTAPTGAAAGPDMSGVYGLGRAIFAAGGGALGPQALEGLGPTGTSMLQSVGQAVGADWNTFANSYLRSRIGQGAAQAA